LFRWKRSVETLLQRLTPVGAAATIGGLGGDLDGNGRMIDDPATADTGAGIGAIIDIGAYEYPGGLAKPDFDLDGDVDLSDYGVFLDCYNGPNNPPACE
jgi:hypothetical protein